MQSDVFAKGNERGIYASSADNGIAPDQKSEFLLVKSCLVDRPTWETTESTNALDSGVREGSDTAET